MKQRIKKKNPKLYHIQLVRKYRAFVNLSREIYNTALKFL